MKFEIYYLEISVIMKTLKNAVISNQIYKMSPCS